jgi:lysosomal acid lipase/cholesteryl ester hydrolase
MDATVVFLIIFPLGVICVNFKNNACSNFPYYYIAAFSDHCSYNPDVLSTVPAMVERHGYNVKRHSTTTDDGYILTVFRVTSKNKEPTKSPVFIQHGITLNSANWVDISNRSLAFRLADEGYDVWLGNIRGTTYSNKHKSLNVNMSEYWNFNLDTMAQKDIPSQLKLVANETGKAGHIFYIGYSMGATVAFMYASEYPEESQKLIQGLVALAPVVYLNGIRKIELVKPLILSVIKFLSVKNVKGLFYHETYIHTYLNRFCKNVAPIGCAQLLNWIFGKSVQFQPEDLLLLFSYFPTGTSIYEFEQYVQIAQSKNFQKFDYGKEKNVEIYGQSEPPTYNLSKIKLPVRLLYGEEDSLTSQENVDRLYKEVGSTNKEKYPTPVNNKNEAYNHIDFIYSKYLEKNLYEKLFEILDSQFQEN